MAGAIDDFGKQPTSKKVLVFVAIGLALMGVYWKWGLKPMKAKAQAAEDENETLSAEAVQLGQQKDEYDKLLKRSDQLKKLIEENQKALPTEAELPAFFDTLNNKVSEAGVEVRRWDYRKESPVETFVKVPLEIEIQGTFYQLKRFFASLIQRDPIAVPGPDGAMVVEERERIVTIEELQMFDPVVKNREIVMTAKFIASTFRQADAPPPAAGTPGQPAQPGAAPAPAPAPAPVTPPKPPAPPPAANTPAGAKAGTQDALDKSEQRVKDKLPEGSGAAGSGSAGTDKLKGGGL
jgi:Tfp pilus assembly protein PilO